MPKYILKHLPKTCFSHCELFFIVFLKRNPCEPDLVSWNSIHIYFKNPQYNIQISKILFLFIIKIWHQTWIRCLQNIEGAQFLPRLNFVTKDMLAHGFLQTDVALIQPSARFSSHKMPILRLCWYPHFAHCLLTRSEMVGASHKWSSQQNNPPPYWQFFSGEPSTGGQNISNLAECGDKTTHWVGKSLLLWNVIPWHISAFCFLFLFLFIFSSCSVSSELDGLILFIFIIF